MQHRKLDDLTPEERDPRNQEIVAFLEHAYLPLPRDEQPSEQTLARMRQRLSSAIEAEERGTKPMLRVIRGTGALNTNLEERRTVKQRLTLLAIAAILIAVVGSSLVVFQGMSMRSEMATHNQATSTRTTPLLSPKEQARSRIDQLKSEANRWGQEHLYVNPGDKKSYKPDISYLEQGVLKELEARFKSARTNNDFKQVTTQANEALFLLHAFEREAVDKTAYNQAHQEDINLLDHYQLKQESVIVVSTAQQSLRLYKDGQLVRGFQVTAGSVNTPLPVGKQSTLTRQQNVNFLSPFPEGDPNWYPPVAVKYALQFQTGGYFIFDAAWSKNFGPGSQFPQSGTEKYPSGVWLGTDDMQWLYEHTDMQTQIIIY